MNPYPTNFTEASLAEQTFAYDDDDDVATMVPVATAHLPIMLRRLKWNELVRRGFTVEPTYMPNEALTNYI